MPGVRPIALSQSSPTPRTQELFAVVVSEDTGAPEEALPLALAPTAPEPKVPDVLTPAKLITVMEEATLCDSAAVTLTLANGATEKALQISAVPNCKLLRATRTQVSPDPFTLVTLTFVPEEYASEEINASSSSFPEFVENVEVLTLVPGLFLLAETLASMVIPVLALMVLPSVLQRQTNVTTSEHTHPLVLKLIISRLLGISPSRDLGRGVKKVVRTTGPKFNYQIRSESQDVSQSLGWGAWERPAGNSNQVNIAHNENRVCSVCHSVNINQVINRMRGGCWRFFQTRRWPLPIL
jgi:hypothetical protein